MADLPTNVRDPDDREAVTRQQLMTKQELWRMQIAPLQHELAEDEKKLKLQKKQSSESERSSPDVIGIHMKKCNEKLEVFPEKNVQKVSKKRPLEDQESHRASKEMKMKPLQPELGIGSSPIYYDERKGCTDRSRETKQPQERFNHNSQDRREHHERYIDLPPAETGPPDDSFPKRPHCEIRQQDENLSGRPDRDRNFNKQDGDRQVRKRVDGPEGVRYDDSHGVSSRKKMDKLQKALVNVAQEMKDSCIDYDTLLDKPDADLKASAREHMQDFIKLKLRKQKREVEIEILRQKLEVEINIKEVEEHIKDLYTIFKEDKGEPIDNEKIFKDFAKLEQDKTYWKNRMEKLELEQKNCLDKHELEQKDRMEKLKLEHNINEVQRHIEKVQQHLYPILDKENMGELKRNERMLKEKFGKDLANLELDKTFWTDCMKKLELERKDCMKKLELEQKDHIEKLELEQKNRMEKLELEQKNHMEKLDFEHNIKEFQEHIEKVEQHLSAISDKEDKGELKCSETILTQNFGKDFTKIEQDKIFWIHCLKKLELKQKDRMEKLELEQKDRMEKLELEQKDRMEKLELEHSIKEAQEHIVKIQRHLYPIFDKEDKGELKHSEMFLKEKFGKDLAKLELDKTFWMDCMKKLELKQNDCMEKLELKQMDCMVKLEFEQKNRMEKLELEQKDHMEKLDLEHNIKEVQEHIEKVEQHFYAILDKEDKGELKCSEMILKQNFGKDLAKLEQDMIFWIHCMKKLELKQKDRMEKLELEQKDRMEKLALEQKDRMDKLEVEHSINTVQEHIEKVQEQLYSIFDNEDKGELKHSEMILKERFGKDLAKLEQDKTFWMDCMKKHELEQKYCMEKLELEQKDCMVKLELEQKNRMEKLELEQKDHREKLDLEQNIKEVQERIEKVEQPLYAILDKEVEGELKCSETILKQNFGMDFAKLEQDKIFWIDCMKKLELKQKDRMEKLELEQMDRMKKFGLEQKDRMEKLELEHSIKEVQEHIEKVQEVLYSILDKEDKGELKRSEMILKEKFGKDLAKLELDKAFLMDCMKKLELEQKDRLEKLELEQKYHMEKLDLEHNVKEVQEHIEKVEQHFYAILDKEDKGELKCSETILKQNFGKDLAKLEQDKIFWIDCMKKLELKQNDRMEKLELEQKNRMKKLELEQMDCMQKLVIEQNIKEVQEHIQKVEQHLYPILDKEVEGEIKRSEMILKQKFGKDLAKLEEDETFWMDRMKKLEQKDRMEKLELEQKDRMEDLELEQMDHMRKLVLEQNVKEIQQHIEKVEQHLYPILDKEDNGEFKRSDTILKQKFANDLAKLEQDKTFWMDRMEKLELEQKDHLEKLELEQKSRMEKLELEQNIKEVQQHIEKVQEHLYPILDKEDKGELKNSEKMCKDDIGHALVTLNKKLAMLKGKELAI